VFWVNYLVVNFQPDESIQRVTVLANEIRILDQFRLIDWVYCMYEWEERLGYRDGVRCLEAILGSLSGGSNGKTREDGSAIQLKNASQRS